MGGRPAMNTVIVKPRSAGKSWDILHLAQEDFSYIVCPTLADVQRLWRQALELGLHIPQPITRDEFVHRRYNGGGVRSFVIDDIDRCVQGMTTVEVRAISLTDPSPWGSSPWDSSER